MSDPKRIQLSRRKGWRMPEMALKVDRSTIWGNPFVVGEPSGYGFNDGGDPTPMIAALTLEQCLAFYADLVRGFLSPEMHPRGHEWMANFRRRMNGGHPAEMIRVYLRGRPLACWCKPGQPCHADVLLEMANPDPLLALSLRMREAARPDANGLVPVRKGDKG